MDRRFDNIEMDSTIEYNQGQRDASDPEIELRVHARGIDAGQLLAGITDTEAVEPQTDADVCQAADPDVNHWPVGFTPRGDPAATPPSAAAEASAAWCRQTTHSTSYPTTDAYYGPHPSVSGAAVVDQSSARGSDLGCYVGPSSFQPGVERVVVSTWGTFTPTTTGAHTNTTSTLTSTHVTCSTVCGPVQAAYMRGPPPTGLTSVHPARQVFMPQPIEPSGRFPGALAGPVGILRPPVGTVERTWRDASTRSNLRPAFDMSQVASRPEDTAVNPSGECYLSNGLLSNPVSVLEQKCTPREAMGLSRKRLWNPSRCALPGWKLVRQGYDQPLEPLRRAQVRWGCPATRHHPVHPVGCMSSNLLGRMCSPCVLRHKVLPHRETKWLATSGHVHPVLFLACPQFHFLLM